MIKLKTLLMEADAPKLKDTEKEKAKKLGLVWKGKGYGKEGQDGITHKNDNGKLVKIDKDGGKEQPKSKGLSGSDFDRELPSDKKAMPQPSDFGGDMDKYIDALNKRMADDEKSKSDEPVKINDDAQDTIDSMKWNELDVKVDNIQKRVIRAMDDSPEEWNAQVNRVYDEFYGQIPQEDLDKLASANINTMDLDDEALSEVPESELIDKTEILIDFHKKYSTLGKRMSQLGIRKETIKLKDVMKESKVSYLVEALQSNLLRKFTNRQNFKLDSDFYGWLARLGVRADKITDDMLEKTTKLPGKGVVIAVTGKKVSLPAKGKSYWRSDLEVDKGVVLSVFKDGKAVWWTKSWRDTAKNRKKDIRVADTKGYGFSTSENRTFGLNQFGYQNAASIKKINGVDFYKISLEDDMPYMGGKEVRKLRSDIQVGSWKWRDDESFKKQNKDKYEEAIKTMYDDPEKVQAKIKKAKDYTDGLITGLIGGKPNAAAQKLLQGLGSTRAPEMQAMELMRNITDAMDRLYDKVTYYNNAVKDDIEYEKRNPEHPKSYRNSPKYGKEVAEVVNLILNNKFRGVY